MKFGEVEQKIKGIGQQIKGEIKQRQGKGIKGGMQKLKGRINERIGDARLDTPDDLNDW